MIELVAVNLPAAALRPPRAAIAGRLSASPGLAAGQPGHLAPGLSSRKFVPRSMPRSTAGTCRGMVAARRSLHAATFLGAAVHNVYELACGVGLMFQPELGLSGASVLWLAAFPALVEGALRGGRRCEAPLAAVLGANLAAVTIHYTLWPWRLRCGIPVLTAAEGLGEEQLPPYNAILLAWSAAGLLAVAAEVPRRQWRWVAAGFLAALPLRRHARDHFAWVRAQSRANPSWWNRGFRHGAQPPH